MKNKIAFRSDASSETGKKIIDTLIELGGINKNNLAGSDSMCGMYYIGSDNIITGCYDFLPIDYTLKDINNYLTLSTK